MGEEENLVKAHMGGEEQNRKQETNLLLPTVGVDFQFEVLRDDEQIGDFLGIGQILVEQLRKSRDQVLG